MDFQYYKFTIIVTVIHLIYLQTFNPSILITSNMVKTMLFMNSARLIFWLTPLSSIKLLQY